MKNMKKRIIIAIVTMICIFSLTACGPEKDSGLDNQQEPVETGTTAVENNTSVVNDTGEETVEEIIEETIVREIDPDGETPEGSESNVISREINIP